MEQKHLQKKSKNNNKDSTSRDEPRSDTIWNALSQATPNRVPRRISRQKYSMMQTLVGASALVTSTSVPTFVAEYFTLGQLDQVSTLAALFDQYCINRIETWLLPRVFAATDTTGEVASVVDFDDASALTTFAQATDYQNCIVGKPIEGHYRNFIPHVALAGYGGAFTSYVNVSHQWIDCSSTAVQHYGVKFAATVTGVAITYDLMVRYHLSFRNVR
jgi:hypothetical protein